MMLPWLSLLYFGDLAGPPGHVGVSVIDGDSIRDGDRRSALRHRRTEPTAMPRRRAGCNDAAMPRSSRNLIEGEDWLPVVDTDNTDGMRRAKPVRCRSIVKWCALGGRL
jgi:hypothetical protein